MKNTFLPSSHEWRRERPRRERERKRGIQREGERWRQKSKTFLPHKVLRLQLHKSVFHKSYASLFPAFPAGLSFKTFAHHSQPSIKFYQENTDTLSERRERHWQMKFCERLKELPSVSQHASSHGTLITGFHTLLHVDHESKYSQLDNKRSHHQAVNRELLVLLLFLVS